MSDALRPHERWIWTELIGFDANRSDLGVSEYLDTAGFTPDAICLLLTSPDFVLAHEDAAEEIVLPEDVCSRDGHEFNPQRERQAWTNRQLQGLIAGLQQRGIEVYLTVFTRFYGNRFHHEWLSDHPEACKVFRRHGWAASLNCLARLSDGSYFEDYFIPKLVQTLDYYGFDGWHGADGWGPLNGPIYEVDLSDDMVGQFAETVEIPLPEEVTRECGHDTDLLEARARWLWRNARREWIGFYADRWAAFWAKALDALHAAGKRAMINSAWGRAPWEALYRYGIDYRRIVEAGVDGIVVETVAAGLSMDPRPNAADVTRHADFLSMLMLMRGGLPDARLIFLHNTHDTVEEWDAIRHKPTLLEKEIFSLSNVYSVGPGGEGEPCADGFLVCLGDGLDERHWEWLRARWQLAWSGSPRRPLGVTLLWADDLLEAQMADFTRTRSWTVHRLLFHLMTEGAPEQAVANLGHIDVPRGPALLLNHHLLAPEDLLRVIDEAAGPLVLIGRADCDLSLPEPSARFADRSGPLSLSCLVYGADVVPPAIDDWEPPGLPDDLMALEEPRGYWDHFTFRPVSPQFLRACARVTAEVSDAPRVVEEADNVLVMATEERSGRIRVALKNKSRFYMRPTIDMRRPIERVDILTHFPSLLVRPEGPRFSVRVPPEGITVVEVQLADDDA